MHIGLLVPWVVALVGYEVYGVGGVAYGLALAVFLLAILDELGRREPSTAPADDGGASTGPAAAPAGAADGEAAPPDVAADRPTSVPRPAGSR